MFPIVVLWIFLSLRYGADLRRSRLFSADNLTLNGPLFLQSYNFSISYNSYLAYEVVFLHHLRNSTGPKGTPLEYFRLCETFFEKKFTKLSPFNLLIFSDRMDVEKSQRVPPFSFFGIVRFFSKFFFIKGSPIHQYFGILKSFCYFWALDMVPTWAVPGLFVIPPPPSQPTGLKI